LLAPNAGALAPAICASASRLVLRVFGLKILIILMLELITLIRPQKEILAIFLQ